jgi:hypothetical protein
MITDFTISIENPQTQQDKEINGSIKIKPATEGDKTGYMGVGDIAGFPDGSIFDKRTDVYPNDTNFDKICNEIISFFKEKIKTKYGIDISLKFEEIKVDKNTNTEEKKDEQSNKKESDDQSRFIDSDLKKINSELTIFVLEGPGPIIGNNKLKLKDGSVTFDDIEFSEAGDYTLQIKSDNPDIEPINIGVSILEKEVEEQQERTEETDKKQEIEEKKLERPKITQILDPKIILDPISLPLTKNKADDKSIINNAGNTPSIQLNIKKGNTYEKLPIDQKNILDMDLFHNGSVPCASADIKFVDKKQKTKLLNLIGSSFDIFMKSNSSDLKSIHLRFRIDKSTIDDDSVTISGTLDIDDLYIKRSLTTKEILGVDKATSFEILKKISIDLKLGFNSNMIETDDSMNWTLNNESYLELFNNMAPKVYSGEDNYHVIFIDYYYCLNIVNLNKEEKRDITNDVNVETGPLSKDKSSAKLTNLILSNDPGYNMSNLFLDNVDIFDNTSLISKYTANITISKTYNSNNKIFEEFAYSGVSSNGELNLIPKTDYSFSSFSSISRINLDNVHPNYNYTQVQQEKNFKTLNNYVLTGELINTNYSIYKYQKVKVNYLDPTGTPTDVTFLNNRWTGEYIITGLDYYWDGKSLKQNIRLSKREIGKTVEEIKATSETPPVVESKENNKNPEFYEYYDYKPNQEYVVGNTYTIENSVGDRFLLTIKSLSDDGNKVVGQMKQIIPASTELLNTNTGE